MFNIISARSVFCGRTRVVDVHVEYTGPQITQVNPILKEKMWDLPLHNFLNPPNGMIRVRTEWHLDAYGKNLRLHAVDEPAWMDPEQDADSPIVVGG